MMKRADFFSGLFCAGFGLLLAVAPHLATLARRGTLEYLADTDDGIYLAVARAPYYGEKALRDSHSGPWENVPSLYSWMQFVPLAKLTRMLGLPLVMMSLLWRTLGGLILGGALFVLFRKMFSGTKRPMAWALGCSLVCLSDAGFGQGRTVLESFYLAGQLWNGTTLLSKADGMPQYRVVQPLLHIPILLLLIATLLPGKRNFQRTAFLGAFLLGMLVLLNFFFWTAAVLGLGIYAAWLLLKRRDAAEAGLVAAVLVGGLLIGCPQIISNARTFAIPEYKPIMDRLIRPLRLEPGDPTRRLFLRNFWVWGKLAAGAGGGLPGLDLLWCLTLAGYLLANSAIVTGLEFQNAHWFYFHAPMGEILLLGVVVRFLDRRFEPAKLKLLWAVPGLLAAIALVWRPYEALRAPETVELSLELAELRFLAPSLAAQKPECILTGPPQADTALLFSRCGQLYHFTHTAHGSLIPDEEVHERHALNGWLQGMDEASYLKTAATDLMSVYEIRGWDAQTTVRKRSALFKELMEGRSERLLARYRPSLLLLPSQASTPVRGGPWALLRGDAKWALYSRSAEAKTD